LRKGFKVIAQVIVPAIAEIYRFESKSHADDHTVVAFSSLAFGAPRGAGKNWACPSRVRAFATQCHPHVFADQGMMGNVRFDRRRVRRGSSKGLFRLIDALIVDRRIKEPLNIPCVRRWGLPARSIAFMPPLAAFPLSW